jgi:hypothetical protein
MDLIPLHQPLAGQGYEPLHRGSAVTVYRRKGSQLVELGADGQLASTPARVRAVLLDYGQHASYVKGVAESRVLARGASSLVVYQRLRVPVLSSRDYTLVVDWGSSGSLLWTRFGVDNRRGPGPRPGLVRVYIHEGGWLLAPGRSGGTVARYLLRLDLGGSLPRWLARSGAGREIPALFESIGRRAR